jgi:hypothetical protein
MNLTEEDKIHLNKIIKEQGDFIREFKRLRQERYNALTYEQKISMFMMGYRFSLGNSELSVARRHLGEAIRLLFEKIEKEHCL